MNPVNGLKTQLKKVPLLKKILTSLRKSVVKGEEFPGSTKYWENRYIRGGNSGAGSYNQLALFKAEFLNEFVRKNGVKSIVEFGCGDGNQLTLATYPRYTGVDVSGKAVELCRNLFKEDPTKTFVTLSDYRESPAELSMSLDVIYHLVEDEIFHSYMERLFQSASRYVIIYSSHDEGLNGRFSHHHVRHRNFKPWVEKHAPDWKLESIVPNKYPLSESDPQNTSFADFFIYTR